jgi:hypothetical protein
VDINDLIAQLGPEATPEVDWSAPEAGSFPPDAPPGTYEFIFKLREDTPFDVTEIKGGKYLQVLYDAQLVANGDGSPIAPRQDGQQPTAAFQRTSFYKPGSMPVSFGADLLRSLGQRIEGSMTPQAVVDVFRSLSGRARGKAELIWRTYFDDTETTISTSPRKSKGELPWPRSAQGELEPMATDPKTGKKQYGRLEIWRFKLPQ